MKKIQTLGNKVIWESFIQKTRPKAVVTNDGPKTSDISMLQAAFTCFSADNPISVYSTILTALHKLPSRHKWEMVTPQMLKCWVLNNANNIKKLLAPELNSIHNVMKEFSGFHLFTASKVKILHKVNILNKVFGDGIDMKETPPVQRRKVPIVKKRHVRRLQILCRRFLLDPCYPKEAIAAVVCSVKVEEEMKSWEGKCTLQSLYVDLPFMGKKCSIYWYPEKDHILGDLTSTFFGSKSSSHKSMDSHNTKRSLGS